MFFNDFQQICFNDNFANVDHNNSFFKETNRILSTDYLPTDMDIISFPIKYHFCPLNLIECEKKNWEELEASTNSPVVLSSEENHQEVLSTTTTTSSPSPTNNHELNDIAIITTTTTTTKDLISFDEVDQNVTQVTNGDFTNTISTNMIEQHDLVSNNTDSHGINMRGNVVQRDDFDHLHSISLQSRPNDAKTTNHSECVMISTFKASYSDDMFVGDISIYKDSMDSLDLDIEKSPLEFIFKRTPYTIFSTSCNVTEEKVMSAIRELSIDSIAVISSLHDIDRRVQAHHQIPILSFMNGQVMVDGKSASSIVNTLRMCEKLLNQEPFADTQIIFIFTHNDVFVSIVMIEFVSCSSTFFSMTITHSCTNSLQQTRKIAQDPNLLKHIFPTYQPSNKKSPQRYIEEVFETFNDKFKKRRRFHFSFVNTLDKDDVKRSFKTIHEIVHSVELKRQLETYKML